MVGERLKQYRKRQKLTLKALADSAGLSIGYISQMERGLVEPSLSTLRKIAAVLDVPPYLLLEHDPKDMLTQRSHDQLIMRNKEETVLYEFLSPLPSESFIPQSLIVRCTMKPHSQLTDTYLSHDSEELLTVLSGRLVLVVGDREIALGEGDSSIVRKSQPHNWRNDSDETTQVIACLTPPMWGRGVF